MAAHMGLKAALIDLDLMFGNLHDLMGIEEAVDLCGITGPHDSSFAGTQSVEATAMRVATGLTLWGLLRAEHAVDFARANRVSAQSLDPDIRL